MTPKRTFAEKARAVMASKWFRPAVLVVVTAIVTVELHNKYLEWEARREIVNSPEWLGRNSDRDRSLARLSLGQVCDLDLTGDALPEVLMGATDRSGKPVLMAFQLDRDEPLWILPQDGQVDELSCYDATIVTVTEVEKKTILTGYNAKPTPKLRFAWPVELRNPTPIINEDSGAIWLRGSEVKGFLLLDAKTGETERAPEGIAPKSSRCRVGYTCLHAANNGEFEVNSGLGLAASRMNERQSLWTRESPPGTGGLDAGIAEDLAVGIVGKDQLSQTLEGIELVSGKTVWSKPAFKLSYHITSHYVLTRPENSKNITVLDPKTGVTLRELALPKDWL